MGNTKDANQLFWKICGTLLFLLILLGLGYVMITTYIGRHYLEESNQRLYGNIAEYTVKEVKPLVNGQVDTMAIQDIMHSMMVINPSVEVYLLDTEGKIITFVAPDKTVKLEQVDLTPVKQFIASEEIPYIRGDDPRNPGQQKVFSAAPIMENDHLVGYVYVILASQEQSSVTSGLLSSYILRLGTSVFFLTLLVALVLGLLAIWYLTKNLRTIIETVQRFKEGDYAARIAPSERGDFRLLVDTYNDMAARIEDHIEQMKTLENLRRELIANVSHDLRTPLAIMRGYVETMLIKEGELSEVEKRKYLNIVLDSSEKLSRLVSQLFEYSKLEAAQITPQKEPFFIADLVQDIFAKYQILAQEKGITMKLDQPQKLPLVFADLGLVERVIQNLMDNALKFTPAGGSVSISLQEQDENVEVRISDTGPGIPLEEQSFIFERYRKALTNEKGKGAGLGLAIAKKIMEIHNRTIQVQSQPNEGASFLFQLPRYDTQLTL